MCETSRVLRLAVLTSLLGGCETGAGTDMDAGDDEGQATTAEPRECADISFPVLDQAGSQELELVATRAQIPGLADQPTARGQALGALFAFDGRLHLGYGDYSDNTGPIAMSAWDPELGAFVDFGVAPTEEVQVFFPAEDGSALYIPATDPDGHQESGGVYRLDCGYEEWTVQTPISGAVHVYDLAAQGERLYAGTGSVNGAPALLMMSQDRGESWTELLRRDSAPDRYSRFYFLGATANLLFVSGRDYPSPNEAFAWVRYGEGEFEAIDNLPDGSLVPIRLGQDLAVTRYAGSPGRSELLGSYWIEGASLAPASIWPVAPDGTSQLVAWTEQPADDGHSARLLVLMAHADGGASLHRSEDLGLGPDGWELLATLDALDGTSDSYISMALLFNDVYLGTRTGSLYALRELDLPGP